MQSNAQIEPWDLTKPAIPTRSRLYNLDPIGVGTPDTESLISYISRLAIAHSVTPRTLIIGEIYPHLGRGSALDYGSGGNHVSFYKESAALNSMRTSARAFVKVLAALTSRRELRYLTMLTWVNVLSTKRLIRPMRAWCPCCYQEARDVGQPIYERLLWAITDVVVCPHHRVLLRSLCPHPHCRKPNYVLTQRSVPGYCSRCGQWLGEHVADALLEDGNSLGIQDFDWHVWVSDIAGQLIQCAPILLSPPSCRQLTETISDSVEYLALTVTANGGCGSSTSR